MGEVANIYDGTHQTPKYTKEGVKFVSVENINDIENTNKFITPEAFQKEYKIKPQKGDILMTRITAGIIGATAIIKNNEPLGYYVSLALIRTKVDVDIIFLSQRVETNQFKNQLHKRIIHVAFPKKINLGDIQDCATYFPSLDEQKKISSLISLINDRILLSMKIIEDLMVLKNNVVKKLFENKLKFKNGDEDFQKWEKKRLTEISKEHLNKNPENLYAEVFSVSKHKGVINQIEHLGRSFSAKDIKHYKVVYPGDLVYTKSPTSEFPFGIIKQNRTGRIGVVSPLYCVFTPQTFELGYLLHEYFNSSVNTYNYLNPLVQKGAKNTMNINNETFLNGAKLLLPIDKMEQTHIYTALSLLDDKIDVEERILLKYENQKKYLLANLFI